MSSSTSILKQSVSQAFKKVCSFSPNGKQLVSVVGENVICIWETATGVCTHMFRDYESCFIYCRFSADGKQILSGTNDKKLRIWDVDSTLSTHKGTMDKRNQKGLSLLNANIEGATGLSDNNIMLLFQRGAYGFSEGAAKIFASNIRDIIGDQDENGGELDFTNKNLNAESIRGMARFTTWINLKVLDLSYNQIGNKSAIDLGENTSWVNLREFYLDDNRIEDEGARGLAENKSWCKLQILSLKRNMITDDGEKRLASNAYWKELKDIYLEGNGN